MINKRVSILTSMIIATMISTAGYSSVEFETKNKVSKHNLFETIRNRAIETGATAFATARVIQALNQSEKRDLTATVNWTNLSGIEVLHLKFENLEDIKEIALGNLEILSKVRKTKVEVTDIIRISASDVPMSIVFQNFEYSCLIGMEGKIEVFAQIHIHQEKTISIDKSCQIFAWLFAAYDFKLVKSSREGAVRLTKKVMIDALDVQ